MREAGARLRLELVAGQVLGLEGKGLGEVALEMGGALSRNPVDEIERDVVKTGITQTVHGPPDVLRIGPAFEDGEQMRLEALCAERDASGAQLPKERRQLPRDRLRIRLDRDVVRRRQGREQPSER